MLKIKKKLLFFFTLIIYFSVICPSYGVNLTHLPVDQVIYYVPNFSNITSFTNNLEISENGFANATVFVSSRNTNRIIIFSSLQKFENSNWVTIKSWKTDQNGTYVFLDENCYVSRGYQYRLNSKCEIYSNNNLLESETSISISKFY